MKTGQLRFGLVGYGAWGQCHAGAIQATDGAELAGVAVPSRESRDRAVTDHPQAFVTSDYRELVERDDIDVIDIVLPSHLHECIHRAVPPVGCATAVPVRPGDIADHWSREGQTGLRPANR